MNLFDALFETVRPHDLSCQCCCCKTPTYEHLKKHYEEMEKKKSTLRLLMKTIKGKQ